jgi:SAM-dependent methyltransferase
MTELKSDNPLFWQERYQGQETPWNLGEPAPAFVHLLKERAAEFKPGKMAVFGSGHGNDAALFGQNGFDVTGFDYVAEAVSAASERYGDVAKFEQASIFELPEAYQGQFDYVLEHTCFCAILPKQRADYVVAAANILKPGGRLLGVFFDHGEKGGPPYTTTPEELRQLFSPYFEVVSLEKTPHSIERRKDEELLGIFVRKTT